MSNAITPAAVDHGALSTRSEFSGELTPSAAAAEKQHEIQASIAIARRFPRNEEVAYEKLMRACRRFSFAEDAAYQFPRGGEEIEGPSINLAREAARAWGNIRHGFDIISDTPDALQLRGFAWDLETNTKVTQEDAFQKLVFRKNGGWKKPDERDLRELANRRGAIAVRNCILQLIPKDFIEDALAIARKTIEDGVKADPALARKKLILSFSRLNVTPAMLEQKLGHALAQCTAEELAELRKVFKSIEDGNSTWSEYVAGGAIDVIDPLQVARKSDAKPADDPKTEPAPAPVDARDDTPKDRATSKLYAIKDARFVKPNVWSITTSDGLELLTSTKKHFEDAKRAKAGSLPVSLSFDSQNQIFALTVEG